MWLGAKNYRYANMIMLIDFVQMLMWGGGGGGEVGLFLYPRLKLRIYSGICLCLCVFDLSSNTSDD